MFDRVLNTPLANTSNKIKLNLKDFYASKNDIKKIIHGEYDFEYDLKYCPFLRSEKEQILVSKS